MAVGSAKRPASDQAVRGGATLADQHRGAACPQRLRHRFPPSVGTALGRGPDAPSTRGRVTEAGVAGPEMAWARLATWSLAKMAEMWLPTVLGARPSRRRSRVGQAGGDQVEHLAFAGGQLRERPARRCRVARRSRRASAWRRPGRRWPRRRPRRDRADDLVLLGALDEVAAGAGAHGREHRVVVVEHGQHQHRRPTGAARAISRVASTPSRSGICRSMTTTSGRWTTASRTASWPVAASATISISGSEASAPGARPDHRMVVGDQDPDRRCHSSGRRRGPGRRRGRAGLQRPPSSAARSCHRGQPHAGPPAGRRRSSSSRDTAARAVDGDR